jgi:hypothetical protein
MPLQKCRFMLVQQNVSSYWPDFVECHFNPEQLTLNKTNSWNDTAASNPLPQLTFGGEGRRTLSMTLYFDTFEKRTSSGDVTDVRTITDKLLKLTQPPPRQCDSRSDHRPPHVAFQWGTFRWPAQAQDRSTRAVIESFNQKFTLFGESGKPARAEITLTLKQVDAPSGGQNPTSRAAGARRMRVVEPGDTLDLVAAQELGAASAWRALAEMNELDDPRRLRAGQVLLIPPEV